MSKKLAPSARKMLVDWANEQDAWVRSLAADVLATRQAPSDDKLAAAYEACLVEKGLRPGDATMVPEIEFDESLSSEAADLKLERLSSLQGVNALAPDQAIDFNAGLTILFGENGAGKTGYSRVLKRLAAVRTAEPILPNVHDATAPRNLKAAVAYRIGEEESKMLDWEGESGVAPFTRLSVFDTPSLRLHVDENLTYTYTPGDLALFPLLDVAIGEVRQKLDSEIAAKASQGNPFLQFFTRGTSVYRFMETVGAATDLDEIRQIADTRDDPEGRIGVLERSVEVLNSTAISAQLTTAKSKDDLYEGLLRIAQVWAGFDIRAYNDSRAAAEVADADVRSLRATLFANAGLSGEGEEEWQGFIMSGESYVRHKHGDDYPTSGDVCVYCHQELSPEAVSLIRKYRDFARDKAQELASVSRRTMAALTSDLRGLSVENYPQLIATHDDPSSPDAVLTTARELIEAVATAQAVTAKGAPVEPTSVVVEDSWTEEISARRDAARILANELAGRADERQLALETKQRELNELRDAVELGARLVSIETYVLEKKWCERAGKLSKRIPPVRAALTNLAKVASQELINADFASRFEKECEALRAPSVDLEFPGQKGQAARRKTVPVAKNPSEVLSEGEQKVIGLADFLAEAGLRLNASPVILDDPVNSLDYRRIAEVADRVASLAADRQVVVFTHNIWFTTELLERFEGNRDRCTYYTITDDREKGTVVPGSHPRWDTVKKITDRIDDCIVSAHSEEGAAREVQVEIAYSLIRSWCETVLEMELFAGAIRRYQPNVMMSAIDRIKVERLSEAFDIIGPLFKKACRVTEAHSQPLETLSVRPTLTELEADWRRLQAALKDYRDPSH